jgi:hypothetical protein
MAQIFIFFKRKGIFSQKEVTMCELLAIFWPQKKTDWSHGVTQYYPPSASQKNTTKDKPTQCLYVLSFMASSN